MENGEYPGPLPKRDAGARLEEESIDGLRLLLPKDKLLLRDERIQDYGVDASLEISLGECISHFRSCVQIRARNGLSKNQDGTYSISIKTSTLNYLLNGPCPILILYIPENEEYYYVYLRESISRIESSNPGWRDQETVTIRLEHQLDNSTIDSIFQRIKTEAMFSRRVFDQIAAYMALDRVRLSVDPKTLDITSSEDAKEILRSDGNSLIQRGYADKVIEYSHMIMGEELDAVLHFIIGNALFSRGEYLEARQHFGAAAMMGDEELRKEGLPIDSYSLACEYYMGRLTQEEYLEKHKAILEELEPSMKYQESLLHLREELIAENSLDERSKIRGEIRTLATEVCGKDDIPERIRDSAKLSLHEIELEESTTKLSGIISAAQPELRETRKRFGSSSHLEEAKESIESLCNTLEAVDSLLRKAISVYEPRFAMEVWYTRLLGHIATLRQITQINEIVGQSLLEYSGDISIEEIRNLEAMADTLSNTEFRLRVQMLEAQLHELNGNQEKAYDIASQVLEHSKVLLLRLPERSASAFLSGETSMSQIIEEIRKSKCTPNEQRIYLEPEEQLDDIAKALCKEMGIPVERYEILRQELSETRKLAKSQREWCLHMQMLENKTHMRSAATAYAKRPMKRLYCRKHDIQSDVESVEVDELIAHMKSDVCCKCADREPYID